MSEQDPQEKQGIRLEMIFAIVLVLIIVVAAVFLIITTNPQESNDNENKNSPGYTSSYSVIESTDAYGLINTSDKLIIIDMRTCRCNYEKGHIPGAIWEIDEKVFFNTTSDLLIYDNREDISIEFCENLVNNTYGEIYCLKGGLFAWKDLGYPTQLEE